jgi:2-aminoadipate transaminase
MEWDNLFSETAQRLTPSRPSAIFQMSRSDTISLAGGVPDPAFLPIEHIREATDTVLAERGGEALNYGNGQGVQELREFIADRESTDFMTIDPDNVVITSGSQQGLDLIGRVLLNDGDRVLVRNPTYIGSLMAWRVYNPQWGEVFTHDDDLNAAFQPKPKVLYFVTNYENPTGEQLSLERRTQLVKALATHRVPVVEDDPYGQLRFEGERIPTLLELDAENMGTGSLGGHVIYAGSFSKVLSPGLRVGWIIADKPFVAKLMQIKQGANLCSSIIDQFIVYESVRNGFLDSHIPQLRLWYAERRDAMIAAMEKYFPPGVTFTRPAGGFFIMVTLPEGMDSIELLQKAVELGVVFIPGEAFHLDGVGGNTLRLSFSRYQPEMLDEAIHRLAQAINEMSITPA